MTDDVLPAGEPVPFSCDTGQFPLAEAPSGPTPAQLPPDLVRGLDNAGRVASDLAQAQLALRFRADHDSRRVTIEVLSKEGQVLHVLPARHLGELIAKGTAALENSTGEP